MNDGLDLEQKCPFQLDKYLVLTSLARGGMGEVFLASYGDMVGIQKYCVIKTVRADHTGESEMMDRFIDEVPRGIATFASKHLSCF